MLVPEAGRCHRARVKRATCPHEAKHEHVFSACSLVPLMANRALEMLCLLLGFITPLVNPSVCPQLIFGVDSMHSMPWLVSACCELEACMKVSSHVLSDVQGNRQRSDRDECSVVLKFTAAALPDGAWSVYKRQPVRPLCDAQPGLASRAILLSAYCACSSHCAG